MRFLSGKVHGAFQGEIVSDFKDRPEGIRIKHRVHRNSVKLSDKQGSVLRVETTINDPYGLKVFRPREGDAGGELAWRPMRKGVASGCPSGRRFPLGVERLLHRDVFLLILS
jgi:hypothetical protein